MAQNREKHQSRRYIARQTRKFQLRRDHPADAHVAEILDFAKTQRREVTVIREGVALWWALENGNLEYLFEKFPQYRAQFQPDTSDLIEQFRQMLAQHAPAPQPAATGGPKPLGAGPVSRPKSDDDDDQDTIIIRKDTRTDAAENFWKSAKALQGWT